MAESTVRCFLAIELSDTLKNEACRFVKKIQARYSAFRFIPPDNWHLTLHFLGQVEAEKIEELSSRVSRALENVEPFSIFLEGFGVFPNWHQPRILWIGVSGDIPQLSVLKKQLDQVLQKMHFEIEARLFHPHITVARSKTRVPRLSLDLNPQFKSCAVDQVRHVVLFKSTLSPQGTQYAPVRTFPFGNS